ncbi:hypothetical protein LTR78_007150 [Recurvomyces mirabilis]|uniref:BTB domain-containing protein n=1 Tax=Recurvomyces mirabilis TaxID=574656 RepID=A0AAE1BZ37_9PEZI|nr:hypothetical protein LTR78_007150 [Recurvomyces mirabilis]KAK5150878.1 hypothetical protein LTS14_009681 [Recurvomyces mirabilis]
MFLTSLLVDLTQADEEIDFEDTLNILVGPAKKSFQVPKNLLCERSAFFKAACGGRWQQEGTGIISLPEDCPNFFSAYLQILFRNEVTLSSDGGATIRGLSSVYVLADKLCDLVAANLVMDAIVLRLKSTQCRGAPAPGTTRFIYDHTLIYHPLRRVRVEHCAIVIRKRAQERVLRNRDTPRAFVEDVAVFSTNSNLRRVHRKLRFLDRPSSKWHITESSGTSSEHGVANTIT